eukprot:CAMPEP_0113243154 /NCGR_PEP_ID=MMETSP0008_2-20120614/7715_1 /TAXON_ID=97485 /ORGANISM="Prymnesium parvum" /LENGTH=55 /DNA_ID=CAMNT_0000090683 /DNA_START=69 /DNA_END=236 /DNA_ORIENTATION=- /assembly_acc=CAM_ASM_000153
MPGVVLLQGMPCHGMLPLKDPLWNNVFHSGLDLLRRPTSTSANPCAPAPPAHSKG